MEKPPQKDASVLGRPGKRVIRNIFFLFGLLIAAIVGNTIYVTYQGEKRARTHQYEDLKAKLNILAALQNNALEKLSIVSGIVKEQNHQYCDFLDYDNIDAIRFMLKSLATVHSIDLAFAFDEYGDVLTAFPKMQRHMEGYLSILNDQRQRVSVEVISRDVIKNHLPEMEKSIPTAEALCFKSVIPLFHDTGDIYGYVVLIKLINGNKALATQMFQIAEAEMIYYDQQKRVALTSFGDPQIPYPVGGSLNVGEEAYFVSQKRIADFTGQSIGTLVAAINKRPFQSQQKQFLLNNLTPFFISIIILIAFFFLLKRRVFDKIRSLIAALRKVTAGEGDLSVRLDAVSGKDSSKDIDEVDQMGIDFNLMMDKLESTRKQLIDARKQAEMASISKSEFLANMSHEIRTPMNAVIGFSDMLLETPLNDAQTDYARMINNSGDALLSLINDILDFSKIEAGETLFEEKDFNPEALAYHVCDLIRPRIGTKPIELLCRVEEDVPRLVRGDPVRFQQVLTNLMDNAPKFTHAGEIELNMNLEAEERDRVKLHSTVRDTGIGIHNANMAKVFEPFQQADGSTTRKYGGTGLGLSICKKISNLMEGDVWVEQNIGPETGEAENGLSGPEATGAGSTFHFTAWLRKAETEVAGVSIPKALGGVKVLVVDDNPRSLRSITEMLAAAHMSVVSLDGPAAVLPELEKALFARAPFSLCIIDILMPEMDGYRLAALIREHGTSEECDPGPIRNMGLIAVYSAMAGKSKELENAGFDDLLRKPVPKEKLFQSMENVLRKKESRSLDAAKKASQSPPANDQSCDEREKAVRVLIVEDNLVNQKLAKMMLTKAGYHIDIANNGKEAVLIYTANPQDYDMILMDIQMPEMDGIEATEAIRRFENNHQKQYQSMEQETRENANQLFEKHVPVIAMTAHAMKGDKEKCLESGMDDYIAKPIKKEIVMAVLEKWTPKECGTVNSQHKEQ